MKTENNIMETAKMFNENMSKGMKWMQDTNEKLVETQTQQLKTAGELFTKMMPSSQPEGGSNSNNPLALMGTMMLELFQKNVEIGNSVLKKTSQSLSDLSTNEELTKEMDKQMESANKQAADLIILNQSNLDSMLENAEMMKRSYDSLTSQVQKEMQTITVSSKETIQFMNESYSGYALKAMEENKEVLKKSNDQLKTTLNSGFKFWSDLMMTNEPKPVKTEASKTEASKTEEPKTNSPLVKITAGSNNKKHVNEVN